MATVTTAPSDWLTHAMGLAGQGVELTDEQRRCVDALASVGALYNLPVPGRDHAAAFRLLPRGLSVVTTTELSSYDNDTLTRLVVAAHRHCVRVSISAYLGHLDEDRDRALRAAVAADMGEDPDGDVLDDIAITALEITLHARDRAGTHLFERHPSVEDLAAHAIRS